MSKIEELCSHPDFLEFLEEIKFSYRIAMDPNRPEEARRSAMDFCLAKAWRDGFFSRMKAEPLTYEV